MFEKRRIGSGSWERISAREALEILHGVTYLSVVALRVCLISEDPDTIEAMANNMEDTPGFAHNPSPPFD